MTYANLRFSDANGRPDGFAEDQWPRDLIPLSIEPYLAGRPTIPYTIEGVAASTIIEPYHKKGTDWTRHLGIFDAHKSEQLHLPITFYGFIKYVSLMGYGNWNG
ncbi:hypothetical protein EIP86_005224 [Pleurotus ostreatoroseus]|nr:hypothetical protein EIP86_005224 [Pleurotus ostreatoroseus]